MKKNGLQIAILAVGVLILVALALNIVHGGFWIVKGLDGKDGEGKNAYELAVENGYTGSLIEWLSSLTGEDGKSAYEVAVENGFRGTEQEWLLSLAFGEKGADGKDGTDGKNGTNGRNGKDGADGRDGADGVGIRSVFINDEGHLIVNLDNGDVIDAGTVGSYVVTADQTDFEKAQKQGYPGTLADWLQSYVDREHTNGAGGILTVRDARRDPDTGRLTVRLSDDTCLNAGVIPEDGYLSESVVDGFRPCFEVVTLQYAEQLRLRRVAGDFNESTSPTVKYATKAEELICIGKGVLSDGDTYYRFRAYDSQSKAFVDCFAKGKYFEAKYAPAAERTGMNLPDRLTLTVGKPFRFVMQEFVPWAEDGSYAVAFLCDGAEVRNETDGSMTVTASAPGTLSLSVALLRVNAEGTAVPVAGKTVELTVSAKTGATAKGLFIGDSRVESGSILKALKEQNAGLTFVGTRTDRYGNPCEGIGGWTTANFLSQAQNADGTVTNPFYNPASKSFDFAYYIEQNPSCKPDYVVFCLGVNDRYTTDSVRNLKTMVDSVHAYDASIRVLVMTEYLAPAASGQPYETDLTRRMQFRYFTRQSGVLAGKESENTWLIPTHLSLDDSSDRIRSEEGIVTDSVHLSDTGYAREADVIAAYLTEFFGT